MEKPRAQWSSKIGFILAAAYSVHLSLPAITAMSAAGRCAMCSDI